MDVSQVACAMGRGVGMCPICENFALQKAWRGRLACRKKNLRKIAKRVCIG